jgi:hypothetical protein
MQFYGENYTEIEGLTSEITQNYVKVFFDHQKEACYIPKNLLNDGFKPELQEIQKYTLPISFLKRIRVIPLYNPTQI